MTTVEERKHLIDDGVVDGKEEEIFNEEVKVSGKKRGGFGAAVQLSDELSQFLGHEILPRTEVFISFEPSELCHYINHLQIGN
jgi:hypothetical protein